MPCVVELGVFFYLWNIHYPCTITNSNSVVTSWDCRLIWHGRLFQVSVSEPRRAIVESFVFIACSCQFWPKTTDTAQENQGGLFFVHPRSLLEHELLAKKKKQTNKQINKQNKTKKETEQLMLQCNLILSIRRTSWAGFLLISVLFNLLASLQLILSAGASE